MNIFNYTKTTDVYSTNRKERKLIVLSGDKTATNQKDEDGYRENGNMRWNVESC